MATAVGQRPDFAKSFWTIVTDSTTAKTSAIKDWFKLGGYIGKWGELYNPNLPGKSLFATFGDGKNIISMFEFPKNAGDFVTSFTDNKPTYDKINSLCNASNNFSDFMKLLSRHLTIPHMKHVDGVSAVFTFVGAANNAIKHGGMLYNLSGIDTAPQRNKCISNVISLISDLSYLVFASLAVAAWLGLLAVPAVAILLPLSIALVCSFTNYYFKNLVTLEDENRDVRKVNTWTNEQLQTVAATA